MVMKSIQISALRGTALAREKILPLFFIGLLLGSCGDEKAKDQAVGPATYPTVRVEKRSVEQVVTYPAAIEGVVNSQVRAKVAGYIEKVLVDEGQFVKQGQPLFKLETQSLSRDADAAASRIRVAQVEVDKLEPLVARDIISPVQLETAKANLAQAESNYQSIRANIGYSNINSPVDGVVGTIPYRAGNLVSAQDAVPLTTVSRIDEVYAYFSMNEKDFISFLRERETQNLHAMVAKMPPVKLQLADGSEYEHEGVIETISGSVDPNSGTVRFRATFPNPGGLLRNGSSGTIILSRSLENVLVVPSLSTFEQQGQTFVYLVVKDSLKAKSISTLAEAQGLTVLQGLNEGDEILGMGVGKVRPGERIVPQPTAIDSIVRSFDQVFK